MPAQRKAFTPEQIAEIEQRFKQGYSTDTIATAMRVSRDRVERVLAGDLSVEQESKTERDHLLALASDGRSIAEMSRITGMSPLRIKGMLKKAGIPMERRGDQLRKNVTTIRMEPDAWRYVAGAFDASGQFFAQHRATHLDFVIQFGGRSAAVERIRELIGVGWVNHGKRTSTLKISAKVDVVAICEGILPYTAIPNIVQQMIDRMKPAGGTHRGEDSTG
jgi:hypothetical protein